MDIVGLGHYSRTGKDTLANALIAYLHEREPNLRVKKLPMSWKMKQIAHDLYAWAGLREGDFYETPEGEPYRDIVLPDLGMTPVETWVAIGTYAMRDQVHPDTWLNYVLEIDHGCDVLIVPDIRFPNEHAKARQKGAKLVKVVRPGFGPRKTVADRALLGCTDWDIVAGGSGGIRELHEWASRLAFEITGGRSLVQSIDEKAAALKVEVIEPCGHDPVIQYKGVGWPQIITSQTVKGIAVERSPNGPPGYGSRSTVGGA